jgi:hypothetical protein
MKTMTVGAFKAEFSSVIERVKKGEEIAVTYGKKKEIIGYFMAGATKKKKRKLGILEGKASVRFSKNFKITEEALLGL